MADLEDLLRSAQGVILRSATSGSDIGPLCGDEVPKHVVHTNYESPRP